MYALDLQWSDQVKAALSGGAIFAPNKPAASTLSRPALRLLTNQAPGKHGTAAAALDAARAPPGHSGRGFTCPRAPPRNNESAAHPVASAPHDAAPQGQQAQLPFGPWRPERGAPP
jgi:uncharacterized protein (DUF1684 family)